MAQTSLSNQSDTFGDDQRYFTFGSNFSHYARSNFTSGGIRYAHYIDYSWNGFDEDDEPIDEIVVTARRRIDRGWQLYMYLDMNFSGYEVCTNYTDGGHCNATEIMYDPENIPLAGRCQTVNGSTGPLTGQQANELNVDYLNSRATGGAIITGMTTVLGFGVGGTMGALLGAAGGVVTSINGFVGELPYTAGDIVDWSLEACNDGRGGVSSRLTVTIR
jgi:hypothetical protein